MVGNWQSIAVPSCNLRAWDSWASSHHSSVGRAAPMVLQSSNHEFSGQPGYIFSQRSSPESHAAPFHHILLVTRKPYVHPDSSGPEPESSSWWRIGKIPETYIWREVLFLPVWKIKAASMWSLLLLWLLKCNFFVPKPFQHLVVSSAMVLLLQRPEGTGWIGGCFLPFLINLTPFSLLVLSLSPFHSLIIY